MRYNRLIIYAFLVIGTILSTWISYVGWSEVFAYYGLPMKEFVLDINLTIASSYFTLLSIAGMVTLIGFFVKSAFWKPLFKGIVINVCILMLLCALIFCLGIFLNPIIALPGILIASLSIYGLYRLWKLAEIC